MVMIGILGDEKDKRYEKVEENLRKY